MAFVDFYGQQVLGLGQPAATVDITDTSEAPMVARQFPLGAYFDRTDGWLPPTAKGIARFLSRLRERYATMTRNMDPRTADELLDEWESQYEIEPEGTLDERRDLVLAKKRSTGGATADYYEGLASDFGYPGAVVTDAADPFTTVSLADDFLAGGEWKLTFLVTVATQGIERDNQLQRLINSQLLAGWFALYDFT